MTTDNKKEQIKYWVQALEDAAKDMGMDLYPQIFEFINKRDTLDSVVSHTALEKVFWDWHHARQFERLRSPDSTGGTTKAIEVIRNSDPAYAYMLLTYPLPLLIVVGAHTLAHNNFFKVNDLLHSAVPEDVDAMLQNDATLVEKLREDMGKREVDGVLSAARFLAAHKREDGLENMEEDILRAILEFSPLGEKKKRIVRAVIRMSDYLHPQRRTKLMNEGWATFMQWEIIKHVKDTVGMPAELFRECKQYHLKIMTTPASWTRFLQAPSPYWVGGHMWRRASEEIGLKSSLVHLMDDFSDDEFIEEFMTPSLAQSLTQGIDRNFSSALQRMSDDLDMENEDGRKKFQAVIKREAQDRTKILQGGWDNFLAFRFGKRRQPKIVVLSADKGVSGSQDFVLKHLFDGRFLNIKKAKQLLETIVENLWPVEFGRVMFLTRKPPESEEEAESEEPPNFRRIVCRRHKTEVEDSAEPFPNDRYN